MRRTTWAGLFTLLFSLGMLLTACGGGAPATKEEPLTSANTEQTEEQPIKIYTTIYALTDFAQKIAGDKAVVENIVPPGVEPHDFEPTAKDMIKLNEGQLFIYNGAGFEGWVEKALGALQSQTLVVVDASKDIELLAGDEDGHDEHAHQDEHAKKDDHGHGHDHGKKEEEHAHDDHEHEHGEFDPHIWLDPMKAKQQAALIKEALIGIDPANQSYYEGNFQVLSQQFDDLDAAFKDLVSHIHHKEIVVSHAAFGYITNAYGLVQIPISGLSPSNEPSPKQLQQIISLAKEHEIEYILFDTLVSSKVAEVVKREIGAESLTLNTLENLTEEEMGQGKDYFSVMYDNIETLKKALEYHK